MRKTYGIELTEEEIVMLLGAVYSADNIIGGFDDAVEVAKKIFSVLKQSDAH